MSALPVAVFPHHFRPLHCSRLFLLLRSQQSSSIPVAQLVDADDGASHGDEHGHFARSDSHDELRTAATAQQRRRTGVDRRDGGEAETGHGLRGRVKGGLEMGSNPHKQNA